MASSAEQQLIPKDKESKSICIIKRIHFFGRSVKIVMQNENGPCPLLAIANVLSLRNELKLPAGIREITQSELITCIVDLLLERSKHFDAAYAADYQQNISEIFPVLQKLTTGVDVNVKFHNLHAFEPTPEVAVFDLLGIPLVHGWLVDPQDAATAAVFGNKSYNELVEMLFLVLGDEEMEALSTGALRNLSISSHHMHSSFSAIGSPAATAARTPSHGATAPGSSSASFAARSGDAAATQSAALEKALQGLSMSQQQQHQQRESSAGGAGGGDGSAGAQQPQQQQQQLAGLSPSIQQEAAATTGAASSAAASPQQQQPGSSPVPQATAAAAAPPLAAADADAGADVDSDAAIELLVEDMVQEVCSQSMPGAIPLGDSPTHNLLLTRRLAYEGTGPSRLNASSSTRGGAAASATTPAATAGSSSGQETAGDPALAASPAAAAPPPAEGSGAAGGAAAAAQGSPAGASSKAASAADAAMVRSFLEQHCSQLTPYGLHAMADSLKEHQLAVFFRNNHFNALFKYEGAVYLLVTDQGYEYEPDIVWERLDSVQGDTSFCTGDFAPFVPHRAPDGDLGASYSQVVAGGSAAAGAGGNLAALTDLDAAIAASLAAEDQHHQQQQRQQQQQQGSQHGHGLAAAGDEDADFALALQLQLQEEEAMARAQIQQQQQQGQGQGQGQGQYPQQQRQGGSRVAAVQQQEQQAQAQPLESLRQMGQRLATGIQQQYVAATDALVGQQAAMQQQQQQPGRRRSSHAAGGRRGSAAQEEKCSIM